MAPLSEYVAGVLDLALRTAGLPVVGVSIGSPTDRATWKAILLPTATPAEVVNAAALIAAYDLAGLPLRQVDTDAIADVDKKDLIAVSQALWECMTAPTMTKAQLRNRAIAIRKTL